MPKFKALLKASIYSFAGVAFEGMTSAIAAAKKMGQGLWTITTVGVLAFVTRGAAGFYFQGASILNSESNEAGASANPDTPLNQPLISQESKQENKLDAKVKSRSSCGSILLQLSFWSIDAFNYFFYCYFIWNSSFDSLSKKSEGISRDAITIPSFVLAQLYAMLHVTYETTAAFSDNADHLPFYASLFKPLARNKYARSAMRILGTANQVIIEKTLVLISTIISVTNKLTDDENTQEIVTNAAIAFALTLSILYYCQMYLFHSIHADRNLQKIAPDSEPLQQKSCLPSWFLRFLSHTLCILGPTQGFLSGASVALALIQIKSFSGSMEALWLTAPSIVNAAAIWMGMNESETREAREELEKLLNEKQQAMQPGKDLSSSMPVQETKEIQQEDLSSSGAISINA